GKVLTKVCVKCQCIASYTGIAGGAVHLLQPGALTQFPYDGVLAGAVADYQDPFLFHTSLFVFSVGDEDTGKSANYAYLARSFFDGAHNVNLFARRLCR